MKKILVSMLAVAAMVACSNEHTLVEAPKSDAIGFDTFVDNSTRAKDVTTSTLQDFGFNVYASVTNGDSESGLILTNEAVKFANGAWSYDNTQYWVAGNTYNFAAFAPAADAKWAYTPADDSTEYYGTAHYGEIYFDNAAAAANQDLVFAYADRAVTEAYTSTPESVKFTFAHMLSRVRFSFTNSFQSNGNIKLKVTNVHITNAYAEGTLAVENGAPVAAWTNLADKTLDVKFGDAAATIEEGKKESTVHFYLIPNSESATYTVTFKVTLIQAGVEIDTYEHKVELTCAMNRGCSYDITTSLTPENTSGDDSVIYPIVFDVEKVEEWGNYSEVALEAKTVATAAELATAIAEGGEIRLTEDINLDAIATTRAASYGLFIENDCVLDGNGHVITTTASRAIAVSGANDVTLKNFTLNAAGERGLQVQGGAKKVTIENVTATSANYTVSLPSSAGATNVTINNCDLKGLNTINVAAPGAVVTVNDTIIRCEDNNSLEGYAAIAINADAKDANVTVNGGEVIISGSHAAGTYAGAIAAVGANISFNGTAGDPLIKDHYFAIEYGVNSYVFSSFEDALSKAVDGETIKLLQDLTTDKTLKVTNKKITLDLNGKSLNVTNPGVAYTDAITATTGAELTITGNGTVSADWGAIVAMKDAKVVVVNGTFYGNESEVVFVQNTASVEILGGSYKQNQDPSITLNKLDKHRDTTSIVVKGGKYFNFNPADNAAEGANTNFVATGYTVEQEGDWYVVK